MPAAAVAEQDALPAKLDALPAKLDALPAKLDALPAKLDDLPAKLDDLPAKLDDLPAKLDDLPAKLARAAAGRITREATHLEREQAVSILTGLGEIALAEARKLAAAPEPFKRLAAVEILSGLNRSGGEFVPFLRDSSYTVRAAAIDGMRKAFGLAIAADPFADCPFADCPPGDGEGLPGPDIGALLPLLDDDFWPVRRAAVLALAASRSPRAAGPVLRALGDPEPEVRRAVLFFMDELTADFPAPVLRDAASNLSEAELARFLERSLPLARPGNAVFFREMEERLRGSAAGLHALCAAIAAGDRESGRDAAGPLLPLLIDVLLGMKAEASNTSAVLLGWAAAHHQDELVKALEDTMLSGRHPPDDIIPLLWPLLGSGAIKILDHWARDSVEAAAGTGEPKAALHAGIVEQCLANLDSGLTPQGAAALAGLIPLLDGNLRRRAVSKAADFVEHQPLPGLIRVLASIAAGEGPPEGCAAFGGLSRVRDLPAPVAGRLIERFRSEKIVASRETFAVQLSGMAHGPNRDAAAAALLGEIEQAGPAAVKAGAHIGSIANEAEAARAAAALAALFDPAMKPQSREDILLALVRLGAPEADPLVARETERLLGEVTPAWICRLIGALGGYRGEETGALLLRMGRDENPDIRKTAVRSLLERGDAGGLDVLAELFPLITTRARCSLLEILRPGGLNRAAAPLLEELLRTEKDGGILAAVIEALDAESVAGARERLLELSAAPFAAGKEAAEAAIFALGRYGDPGAVDVLKQRLAAFLEEARTAPADFFDTARDRPAAAFSLARALAECGDPGAPALCAGLLFQSTRAQREAVILRTWEASAGGPETREDHSWIDVLGGLLLYPDDVVEEALLRELNALERSGNIFLMGDAAFGVVFRELAARKRCPRLGQTLRDLIFRCRPDLSPAEFRLCVILGDEAAEAGRPVEAAGLYLHARFIMKFNPPARSVVRDMLPLPDAFTGYEPGAALRSEACTLLAGAAALEGKEAEAVRRREWAGRSSPFWRLPPDARPRKLDSEGEDRH